MIDWTRAYSAEWRVFSVDAQTWADDERVGGVDSVEVRRDCTGTAPLLESGSMDVTGAALDEGYYRVALTARQDGALQRADMCTLLMVTTKGGHDHGVRTADMVGRSVLWPAYTAFLPDGAYAPAGVDGAHYVAELLRDYVAAPVSVDGDGFVLADNVVYQLGSRALEAAWSVLKAGGWTMQVHGDGTIHLLPLPSDPALYVDSATARLLRPSVAYELDYSDVPNRYVAISGSASATITNDSPDSLTSTVTRGYVHEMRDSSPVLVEGESLEAYARRRLREESTIDSPRTYDRRWSPDVLPDDVIRFSLPSVGMDGDMRVRAQTIRCGDGVELTEKSATEVALWT